MRKLVLGLTVLTLLAGCGSNSVTQAQIAAIKPADVLTWRYQKDDGKAWMYCDYIEKVEGDEVTFTTSKGEGTSRLTGQLKEFSTKKQTTSLGELKKYHVEQGAEKKRIIEIEHP